MANYAADADNIYGPQQAAEKATLDNSYQQTMQGYDKSQSQIDSSKQGYDAKLDPYAQALNKLLEGKNSDVAQTNYQASNSGLFGSGLNANTTRIIGESYVQNVNQTEAERAAKLSDISTARTNATNTYNTNLGALNTKYQGLKNEYVTTKQQQDAENAANRAAMAKAFSGYGSSGGSKSSAPAYSRADYKGDLTKLESTLKGFQASGYKGGNKALGDFANKANVIKQLSQAYKGIISPQEITGYVNQLYSRYYVRGS